MCNLEKDQWIRLIRHVMYPTYDNATDRRVYRKRKERYDRLKYVRSSDKYHYFENETGRTYKFNKRTITFMEIIKDD